MRTKEGCDRGSLESGQFTAGEARKCQLFWGDRRASKTRFVRDRSCPGALTEVLSFAMAGDNGLVTSAEGVLLRLWQASLTPDGSLPKSPAW